MLPRRQPLCFCACSRSYEARASGVKRNMRGDQARAACPEIQLVQVGCGWKSPEMGMCCEGWRRWGRV